MVRSFVRPLRDDGVLGVDGFFLAFAPDDGPACYSTPAFYAVELTTDDIDLDVDEVFLGSVLEALVVLAAPLYGTGIRDLLRAGFVAAKYVRDNFAQVAASTVAARHSGT